ncbi:helix-hairpin-helix domain-containing protein [uncultured Thomasclavelia sp.]|uniref:ComEA family DNA-binding protein n=1 Tax=uncultured Thomasclavelia sp. TaxID=3025759 RepID=UPI0025F6CD63|nr:helix-hairpin-helix domain-containing protein [uncultured Thomasclavelia sp.]
MKKHEVIGLMIILIISTFYSLVLPDTEVVKIEKEPEIKIIVEGKYNETLIFEQIPTIGDVFYQLAIENTYGFDDTTVLESQSVFYIPENNQNLISLNHASIEELMTIKGIGPQTAQKIIDYRNQTPFKTIEDIKNVSGIGEKTYLRIRELLCL